MIIVATQERAAPTGTSKTLAKKLACPCDSFLWLNSPSGRARQLNYGAQHSQASFVWFLHADSQLSFANIDAIQTLINYQESLCSAQQEFSDSLWYFNLKFFERPHAGLLLNQWATNCRSRWLNLPFGDQGYFMRNQTFQQLGLFTVSPQGGEDHQLIWQAKRQQIKIQAIDSVLATSARKYKLEGWLRVSLQHQLNWIPMAIREYFKKFASRQDRIDLS